MELEIRLKNILSHFSIENNFESFSTFSSGHINDTYLIITNKSPNYILQRLNGNVFKKAEEVIQNKIKISQFLQTKKTKTIDFIETIDGGFSFKDEKGFFWSLSLFIENSQTFLYVKSKEIAFEAGKITGQFLANTSAFKNSLVEILPNFHSMYFRFSQFDKAFANTSIKKKDEAKEWIDFTTSVREEMLTLENAIQRKKIPLRITHNDTKISNILFSKEQKAICLIDLDTVMKGIIHFDYGDALRTICNTTKEDEQDLSKVDFNLDYFKNYTKGFLESLHQNISKNEISYLPLSPKIMTFIMGLRFLTDFLNNDIYYKTNYKNHNLDRAKNQFTLVKKIKEKQQEITNYIQILVS